MIPLYHAEEVVGGVLLVGEDEAADAFGVCGAPVEAATDIGRSALLTAFEQKHPNLAGALYLVLQSTVQIFLRMVEDEGLDAVARVFGPDLEAA